MWQYRAALTTGGDTAPGSSALGQGYQSWVSLSLKLRLFRCDSNVNLGWGGFTIPQFICPIRTLKGRGTNFTTEDIATTYCPTNSDIFDPTLHLDPHLAFTPNPVYGPNNQWELDPDNKNCTEEYKKFVFATCKNTCPGGERIFHLNQTLASPQSLDSNFEFEDVKNY